MRPQLSPSWQSPPSKRGKRLQYLTYINSMLPCWKQHLMRMRHRKSYNRFLLLNLVVEAYSMKRFFRSLRGRETRGNPEHNLGATCPSHLILILHRNKPRLCNNFRRMAIRTHPACNSLKQPRSPLEDCNHPSAGHFKTDVCYSWNI